MIFSYVYFVELFSESRYSWFPSQSTKIHDSYMFCNYDIMIQLPPPIQVQDKTRLQGKIIF